jgi:hypothetical protein
VNVKLTSDLKKNVKYENSIKNLTVFIITIEAQIAKRNTIGLSARITI